MVDWLLTMLTPNFYLVDFAPRFWTVPHLVPHPCGGFKIFVHQSSGDTGFPGDEAMCAKGNE